MTSASSNAVHRVALTSGHTLHVRPLDLSRDIPTLHAWFTQPRGRFWGLTRKTVEEVRGIYAETLERGDHQVFVGELDEPGGALACLFESYDPAHDVLATHYPHRPGDRAFHLFVSPDKGLLPDFGLQMLRAMCSVLLADPTVQRIVAEPDVHNARMFMRVRQAGFRLGRVVHLPHKCAQMVYLSRAAHEAAASQPAPPRRDYPLRSLWVRPLILLDRVRRKLG